MNRQYVCYGVYSDGQSVRDYRCDFREECQYFPLNHRWLAENYMKTETFGDGTIGEIKPPPMPPPSNQKTKVDYRHYTPPRCQCPFFLPRHKELKRKTISTPFD